MAEVVVMVVVAVWKEVLVVVVVVDSGLTVPLFHVHASLFSFFLIRSLPFPYISSLYHSVLASFILPLSPRLFRPLPSHGCSTVSFTEF